MAVASIALAGCGSKPATRASVIARGNAICETANRALANLPPAIDESGSTVNFVKAAPIVTREARTLAGLPRPARARALLEQFLTADAHLAAGYRHLAAMQRAGNAAAEQRSLTALARNDAASLARRYGLTQCSAAAATVH